MSDIVRSNRESVRDVYGVCEGCLLLEITQNRGGGRTPAWPWREAKTNTKIPVALAWIGWVGGHKGRGSHSAGAGRGVGVCGGGTSVRVNPNRGLVRVYKPWAWEGAVQAEPAIPSCVSVWCDRLEAVRSCFGLATQLGCTEAGGVIRGPRCRQTARFVLLELWCRRRRRTSV